MAHFRGLIRGQRGQATRLGSTASGLTVEAQGWQGKVVVELSDKAGVDWARVTVERHQGHGAFPDRVLYDGPIDLGWAAEVAARLAEQDAARREVEAAHA